jgi:hypothetical protein
MFSEQRPSHWVGLLLIQHSILFCHRRLFLERQQECFHRLVAGDRRQALATCLGTPENSIIVFSQLDVAAAPPILLSLLESQKCLDHVNINTFTDHVELVLQPEHVFIRQLIFRELCDSNTAVLGACDFEPPMNVFDSVPVVAPVLFVRSRRSVALTEAVCLADIAMLAPRISTLSSVSRSWGRMRPPPRWAHMMAG